MDHDYTGRVTNAVMKAIFDASSVDVDGQHSALIHTTGACEALVVVLATLVESSPPATTPQAMRLLSEDFRKHLLSAMQGLRREREAGGKMPIKTRGVTLN